MEPIDAYEVGGPLNLSVYAFHLSGLINYELAFLSRCPLMATNGNRERRRLERRVRSAEVLSGVGGKGGEGMVTLCTRGSGKIREHWSTVV